jgi:hypothetical protein
MPSQHRPETPQQDGPVQPDVPRRRRRRIWLAALIAVVLVAAASVAAFVFGPTGSRTAATSSAAGAVDTAASSSVAGPPASSPAAPSASVAASASASARPSGTTPSATKPRARARTDWPTARNTGVPEGVRLRSCGTRITKTGTFDRCRFEGGVTVLADNVRITRSLITGIVNAGSGEEQSGLVISDSTIECGCLSDDTHAPSAVMDSNYTLLRVDISRSGHGAAVKNNVRIEDSYIHDLGANTEAHKDGLYSGDGSNVVIRGNNIECNDGSRAGCTAAIGLLTDFADISHWTIEGNLLNTNGSYCFYGSGGPSKKYTAHHITFVGNHFGRSRHAECGALGPVAYFDVNAPGNVWSDNVWDDSGEAVPPLY